MEHPLKAIKTTFTVNLSLRIVVLMAAATAVSGVVFYSLASQSGLAASYGSVISNASVYKAEILKKSIFIYALFTMPMLAGVVFLSVLYSHRVAGPLQRVKKVSRDIAEGKLDVKVRFRQNDIIHPLAESINRMAESYNMRYSRLRGSVERMQEEAQALEASVKGGDMDDAGKAIAALSMSSKEIERLLSDVKL
ncbi:MAG: HAMP domain-containing protein [Thermodesulfovibrionales bacterium]|nr:HAMP domain-containing protein [Thermodesulfovibrionales bacterium]